MVASISPHETVALATGFPSSSITCPLNPSVSGCESSESAFSSKELSSAALEFSSSIEPLSSEVDDSPSVADITIVGIACKLLPISNAKEQTKAAAFLHNFFDCLIYALSPFPIKYIGIRSRSECSAYETKTTPNSIK